MTDDVDAVLGRRITQCIRLPALDDNQDALPARADGKLIVAAGRLCDVKGFDVALRAFARLEDQQARLVILGEGPGRPALEALASELGVTGVTFAGRVSSDAMGALYEDADIYINASSIDNMPLSIMDAFATGVPVVSTNAGGIPYLVRDGVTGLLVDVEDCGALARASLRLLSDPALALRIADEARRECLERFQWDVVREQWERTYLTLATR